MLAEAFNKAIQDARLVAHNPYLALMTSAVHFVETVAQTVPAVAEYVDELLAKLRQRDFALEEKATNEFLQQLGEGHFLALCSERRVVLERIPGDATRTPDFALAAPDPQVHFEVKTLSVARGDTGIAGALRDASQAVDSIESQVRSGKRLASAVSVVQPFGAGASVAKVIDTVLEKVRQNIKVAQYTRPNTFLVIDLSMLSTVPGGRSALRPLYPDPNVEGAHISGALWMAAFGRPGTDIYGFADFEGMPSKDGIFQKQGILVDPEFECVRGLIFVSHPWSRPPTLWALVRARDPRPEAGGPVGNVLTSLAGDVWNDENDSNGSQL